APPLRNSVVSSLMNSRKPGAWRSGRAFAIAVSAKPNWIGARTTWQGLDGLVYQRQGRYDAAKVAFEVASRGIDKLMITASMNVAVAADAAIFRMNLANLFREQGQLETALTHYDHAIAILKPFTKKKPFDYLARARE